VESKVASANGSSHASAAAKPTWMFRDRAALDEQIDGHDLDLRDA